MMRLARGVTFSFALYDAAAVTEPVANCSYT